MGHGKGILQIGETLVELHKYPAIVRFSFSLHARKDAPVPTCKSAPKQENDQCMTHCTRPSTKRAPRQEMSKFVKKEVQEYDRPSLFSAVHHGARQVQPTNIPSLPDLLSFWPLIVAADPMS